MLFQQVDGVFATVCGLVQLFRSISLHMLCNVCPHVGTSAIRPGALLAAKRTAYHWF